MSNAILPEHAGLTGRLRRDPFEWAVLAALTGLAFAVLAGLLIRTWTKGGFVTGGDGYLVVDPLQYLNWIRQSSEHLAAANLYDFGPRNYTFVHPGILISGLAYRLGLGLVASYALAKPLAVGLIFVGVTRLVHRFIERKSDRRLALLIALFYCAPAAAIAGWTLEPWAAAKFQLDFAGGETWTGSYLWGYVFTAVAVGIVAIGILKWESARSGNRRALGITAACALFAAWLQPWQGATLVAVVILVELIGVFSRRGTVPLRTIAGRTGAVALCALVPLVYYLVLSKTDPAWELAGKANDLPRWPAWVLLVTLLPLALPAAWSYRRGGGRWSEAGSIALRVWPLAALAVYYAPLGTFPFHAVQGIQFPLAVLAVLGVRDVLGDGRGRLAMAVGVLCAAVLIVPGTVYRVSQMKDAVNAGLQPFFLTDDEHAALEFLDESQAPGGVMTENYLGTVIPAWTGRQTWLGAGSWSPDFSSRQKALDQLFAGKLGAAAARELVVRPGAGFILEDCRARPQFFEQVKTFTDVVWKKGCVTVLKVRGVPPQ